MAITEHGRGYPLKLVCSDTEILCYLNGRLFATIGTGVLGSENTVAIPGLTGGSPASAADSARLGGSLPAAFLLIGGTAASASDSDKLDGYHKTEFLATSGTAASASDSTKVGGTLLSALMLKDGSVAFTAGMTGTTGKFSAGLQFGTYVASAGCSTGASGVISIIDASGTVRFIPVW